MCLPLLALAALPLLLSSAGSSSQRDRKTTPSTPASAAPLAETNAEPAPAQARSSESAPNSRWWDGKEDLLRRIERNKYFSTTDSTPASDIQTEDELAAARAEFVFEEFRAWARVFRTETNPVERRKLLEEGIVRAAIRRPHFARLMRSDPREALKQSLPLRDYAALPPQVRAQIEEPFSALVRLRPHDGVNTTRAVQILGEDAWLPCALLPRRTATGANSDCPAQGIRLDNFAVLRDEVIQVLRKEDAAAAHLLFDATPANPDAERCFSSGVPLGPLRATGLSAGKLFLFESEPALWKFNRRIEELDAAPGDIAGSKALFLPRAEVEAAAGFNFAGAESGPRTPRGEPQPAPAVPPSSKSR